ncbi:hypothetical protein SSS_10904, partial [Sarcoptes scabiei]
MPRPAKSVISNSSTFAMSNENFIILTGQEVWNAWKTQLTAYLFGSELESAIEEELPENDPINRKVLPKIVCSLSPEILNSMPSTKSCYRLWQALQAKFEVKHRAMIGEKASIIMNKCIDVQNIEEDIAELTDCWRAINYCETMMSEKCFVMLVVQKCKGKMPYPEIFESSNDDYAMDKVFPSLIASAKAVRKIAKPDFGRIKRNPPICFNCKEIGHLAKDCKSDLSYRILNKSNSQQ